MMAELCATYPGYAFAKHKGYGTPEHQRALAGLGPCAIHRLSFKPVRLAARANCSAHVSARTALTWHHCLRGARPVQDSR